MKTLENKKAVADFPELADQWHPTKNGDFKPCDVAAGSHEKVWWTCSKEHEWYAETRTRTKRGHGCPFCSGQRSCSDNCLATTHPELASQWHKTKNNYLTPNNVVSGSEKMVVWQCPIKKEHEWVATIRNRAKIGSGCPYCAGKKPCRDNCLATTHPKLASQWHKTKNKDLTPNDVTAGSRKMVVWQCPTKKEHEWTTKIIRRKRGDGCPYCSKRKICPDNCLATTHPELASQWHKTKNKDLTPNDVAAGSSKMVVWQCPTKKEHEWASAIGSRSCGGNGCPYCKESKGEKKIAEVLKSMDFAFKREIKFKKCKSQRSLPFDFIVKTPDGKGLLIEYQGIQHYEPIRRSRSWTKRKTMDQFKATQERDKIKDEWARKNKIPLLVIPYWEYENIPSLMEEFMGALKN